MATNRKFEVSEDAIEVDLSSEPPGPPPHPNMIWLGPDVGWKWIVTDDPEDREPLQKS